MLAVAQSSQDYRLRFHKGLEEYGFVFANAPALFSFVSTSNADLYATKSFSELPLKTDDNTLLFLPVYSLLRRRDDPSPHILAEKSDLVELQYAHSASYCSLSFDNCYLGSYHETFGFVFKSVISYFMFMSSFFLKHLKQDFAHVDAFDEPNVIFLPLDSLVTKKGLEVYIVEVDQLFLLSHINEVCGLEKSIRSELKVLTPISKGKDDRSPTGVDAVDSPPVVVVVHNKQTKKPMVIEKSSSLSSSSSSSSTTTTMATGPSSPAKASVVAATATATATVTVTAAGKPNVDSVSNQNSSHTAAQSSQSLRKKSSSTNTIKRERSIRESNSNAANANLNYVSHHAVNTTSAMTVSGGPILDGHLAGPSDISMGRMFVAPQKKSVNTPYELAVMDALQSFKVCWSSLQKIGWRCEYGPSKLPDLEIYLTPLSAKFSSESSIENLEFFHTKGALMDWFIDNPHITFDWIDLWPLLEAQGWRKNPKYHVETSDEFYIYRSTMPEDLLSIPGIHKFKSRLAMMQYVARYPFLLQDDKTFVKTLQQHRFVRHPKSTQKWIWPSRESRPLRHHDDVGVTLLELRQRLWNEPQMLFRAYFDQVSEARILSAIAIPQECATRHLVEPSTPSEVEYSDSSDDDKEGQAKEMEEDNVPLFECSEEMNTRGMTLAQLYLKHQENGNQLVDHLLALNWLYDRSKWTNQWYCCEMSFLPPWSAARLPGSRRIRNVANGGPTKSKSTKKKQMAKIQELLVGWDYFWELTDVAKFIVQHGCQQPKEKMASKVSVDYALKPWSLDSRIESLLSVLASSIDAKTENDDDDDDDNEEKISLVFEKNLWPLLEFSGWKKICGKDPYHQEPVKRALGGGGGGGASRSSHNSLLTLYIPFWKSSVVTWSNFQAFDVKDDYFVAASEVVEYLRTHGNQEKITRKNIVLGRSKSILETKTSYSLDTPEGRIIDLLKNSEGKTYVFPTIWADLKQLNWKSVVSAAGENIILPPWSLGPGSEKYDTSNANENRDYFVDNKDVVHYLKKHGFEKTLDHPSPVLEGRGTRRIRQASQIPKKSNLLNEYDLMARETTNDASNDDDHQSQVADESNDSSQSYSLDTPEGRILDLLKNSEGKTYVFPTIWADLKQLNWKSVMSAAGENIILPPWSLGPGSEKYDTSNGNLNRDYFVDNKDVVHYLRKHGFEKTLDHPSPVLEGRGTRRIRQNSTSASANYALPSNRSGSMKSTRNDFETRPSEWTLPLKPLRNRRSVEVNEDLERLECDDGSSSPIVQRSSSLSSIASDDVAEVNHEEDMQESDDDEMDDDHELPMDSLLDLLEESSPNFDRVWNQLSCLEDPWKREYINGRKVGLEDPGAHMNVYYRPGAREKRLQGISLIKNEDYFFNEDTLIHYLKFMYGISTTFESQSKRPRVTRSGTVIAQGAIDLPSKALFEESDVMDECFRDQEASSTLVCQPESTDNNIVREDLAGNQSQDQSIRMTENALRTFDRLNEESLDVSHISAHHSSCEGTHANDAAAASVATLASQEMTLSQSSFSSDAGSPVLRKMKIGKPGSFKKGPRSFSICSAPKEASPLMSPTNQSTPRALTKSLSTSLPSPISSPVSSIGSPLSLSSLSGESWVSPSSRSHRRNGPESSSSAPITTSMDSKKQTDSFQVVARNLGPLFDSNTNDETVPSIGAVSSSTLDRKRSFSSMAGSSGEDECVEDGTSIPCPKIPKLSVDGLTLRQAIECAQLGLRLGYTPSEILGRDTEISQLKSFLAESLTCRLSGAIFLHGSTGMGKSMVVDSVMDDVRKAKSGKKEILRIQCTCVPNLVTFIKQELSQRHYSIFANLSVFLTNDSSPMVVVVLEEVDRCSRQTLQDLMAMVQLSNSHLVIVGISNTIDFLNDEMASVSRCRTIPFAPYDRQLLHDIIDTKLHGLIAPSALTIFAARSFKRDSDIRRVLEVCRKCLQYIIENVSDLNVPVYEAVNIDVVSRCATQVFGKPNSSVAQYLANLTPRHRIILVAMLVKNVGVHACASSQAIYEAYRSYCADTNVPATFQNDLELLLDGLCDMLLLEGGKMLYSGRSLASRKSFYKIAITIDDALKWGNLESIHIRSLEKAKLNGFDSMEC